MHQLPFPSRGVLLSRTPVRRGAAGRRHLQVPARNSPQHGWVPTPSPRSPPPKPAPLPPSDLHPPAPATPQHTLARHPAALPSVTPRRPPRLPEDLMPVPQLPGVTPGSPPREPADKPQQTLGPLTAAGRQETREQATRSDRQLRRLRRPRSAGPSRSTAAPAVSQRARPPCRCAQARTRPWPHVTGIRLCAPPHPAGGTTSGATSRRLPTPGRSPARSQALGSGCSPALGCPTCKARTPTPAVTVEAD